MRHHLPTPEQNNHYRVNENERFAEKTYHSRSSFQSDPRKPSGSIMEPTGFDNYGFDDVSLSSRCGKASKPEGLRTGSKGVIGTEIGALQAASPEIRFAAFSAIDALWHPVTIIFTRRTFQISS
jgi:hypothetical protein